MDKKMPDIKEEKQQEAKPAPQPPRRQQRRGAMNNAQSDTTDGIKKRDNAEVDATSDYLSDLMKPSKKARTEKQDDSSKTTPDSETSKWTGKIEESKRAASKDDGRS